MLVAILAGGAAFAAFGAAIGASAGGPGGSLLAFMVSLPIAFLSLVPSGTVDVGALRPDRVVVGAVPVRPDARRDERALDGDGPLWLPLLHLLGARAACAARPAGARALARCGDLCAQTPEMAVSRHAPAPAAADGRLRDLVRETDLSAGHLV